MAYEINIEKIHVGYSLEIVDILRLRRAFAMDDASMSDIISKAVSFAAKGVRITREDLQLCREHANKATMIRMLKRQNPERGYRYARQRAEEIKKPDQSV